MKSKFKREKSSALIDNAKEIMNAVLEYMSSIIKDPTKKNIKKQFSILEVKKELLLRHRQLILLAQEKPKLKAGGIVKPETNNVDIPIISDIGKDLIANNKNAEINLYVDGKLIVEGIKRRRDI